MSIALDQEYKFFLTHLEEFIQNHLNQFVLIKGNKVVGFFDSYEKALKGGLSRFGNIPFFIKSVKKEEEVHFFSQGLQ